MAKLIVYENNIELTTIELEVGQEYFVGRSTSSDIIIHGSSVSRKHFRVFHDGNNWQINVLSKFGGVLHDDESVTRISLENNSTFRLDPYKFIFTATETNQTPHAHNDENTDDINIDQTDDSQKAHNPDGLDFEDFEAEDLGFDDKTFVPESTELQFSIGAPFLTIVDNKGDSEELRLDGDYWIVGRGDECEITIDDPKSSRKHCELSRDQNYFSIRDLGSSNGTELNGIEIKDKVPHPINSGDSFKIGKTTFAFEIKDPHFNEKLVNLPVQVEIQREDWQEDFFPPSGDGSGGVIQVKDDDFEPENSNRVKKFKIITLALAAVVTLLVITDNDGKKESASKDSQLTKSPYELLSSQQQEYIEKTHSLAKELFVKSKYELALTEIEKVHKIIPNYKDSKQIESLSKEAIEIKNDEKQLEIADKKRIELEGRITKIVDQCIKDFQSGITEMTKIQTCLEPALELDPENAKAQQLIERGEYEIAQQQNKDAIQAKRKDQILKRKNIYRQATLLESQGKYLNAISSYKRHIASTLPDPEGLSVQSKKKIKIIEGKLKRKVASLNQEAEVLYSQKKYKEAILSLNRAIKLEPSIQETKDKQREYSQKLYINMKTLYGDSVLEENLGNIESAKEKWKKIADEDVPYGEYRKKAKSKLKKYGFR